jgi:3-hydroxyacyl-[acyl-carrier-protein] dehydratase
MAANEQDADVSQSVIEIAEVMQRLPHRYPFLMVDRAIEYVANESIRGIKNVTINEPHFNGHFPGAPVMPGVLLVEAMAQAGTLLMSKTLDADVSNSLTLLVGIDNARFRKPVMPGDVVELPVRVVMARRNVFKFSGRAEVRGQLVAECDITAVKAPRT